MMDFPEGHFERMKKTFHLDKLEDFNTFAKEHRKEGSHLRNMRVEVHMNIFNHGSHFSEDKYNLSFMHAIFLVIFLVLTITNYKRYKEDQERFNEEDSPLYFTFGSLNMMVLQFVLKCIHNFYYMYDGVGSMTCEMMSHILVTFSRITIITILIAFGFGW